MPTQLSAPTRDADADAYAYAYAYTDGSVRTTAMTTAVTMTIGSGLLGLVGGGGGSRSPIPYQCSVILLKASLGLTGASYAARATG